MLVGSVQDVGDGEGVLTANSHNSQGTRGDDANAVVEKHANQTRKLSFESDIGNEILKLQQEQRLSAALDSNQQGLFASGDIPPNPPLRTTPRRGSTPEAMDHRHSMPSTRLPSDGAFTNLYNEMVDENNSSAHVAAVRIPSDTGFSDMYDDIAGEIEQHLQVEQQEQVRQMHSSVQINTHNGHLQPANNVPDRPSTAASTDTYHQAQTLFRDFDGVHYTPSVHGIIQEASEGEPGSRQSSLLKSLPRPDPRVPPPADGMVYYPAPVPMTLNLPQRLSVNPNANLQAKRRTQMLATINADARKSAPWLDQGGKPSDGTGEARKSKARLSALPPQLRASMFFEQAGEGQDVEIKESAVSTLEDLLDASAHAPVSAFTDHPIVGQVGSAVYKRESAMKSTSALPDADTSNQKGRRGSFLGLHRLSMSSINVLERPKLKKKGSRAFSLGTKLDDSALNRNADGGLVSGATSPSHGSEDGEESNESGADDRSASEDDQEYYGPPTTLLAELQIRKAAQKSRNRTALTAFPNGMHSTLLELDAVAQIQRQKRKTARVTLAWEDPDQVQAAKDATGDDENVPLGMLYSGNGKVKAQMKARGMADWDRPLGLIEQREREDNEPLSRRRDRLQGLDLNRRRQPSPSKAFFAAPTVQINGEEAQDSEEEGETLAQRLKRLKDQKETDHKTRPVSEAFSAEMLSHFDSLDPGEAVLKASGSQDGNPSSSEMRLQASSPTPGASDEEEETLGQRRARLLKAQQLNQAAAELGVPGGESSDAVRPAVRASTSMANLLQSFPAGASRRLSDQALVSNLPQDSLLRRAEEQNAARQAMLRKGNVERSSSYTPQKPLIEFSNPPVAPDLNRQNSGGFRGGMYNTGGGGIAGQNMYGYGYAGAQQVQPNFQMAYSGGMASTPGLGLMAYPQLQGMPYNQQQRHSSLMQPGLMPETFIDPRGRARIDEWRQGVQPN